MDGEGLSVAALVLLRNHASAAGIDGVLPGAFGSTAWIRTISPMQLRQQVAAQPSLAGRPLRRGDLVMMWGSFFVLCAMDWQAVPEGPLTTRLRERFAPGREEAFFECSSNDTGFVERRKAAG